MRTHEIATVGPAVDGPGVGPCTRCLDRGDPWDQTQQLILLAFHDDQDFANLAAQELLERINFPAIPLVLDDGRRKVIRREAS